MRSVSLPSIVTYLKAQPTVATLFGTRVFVGEPQSDVQPGIFLCLNPITMDRGEVEAMARVDFRFCAHEETVTKQALIDAQDAVSRVLATGGPVTMGSFVPYLVEEGSDFFAGRDDKNRNILVRDYKFHFIWST